MSAVTWTKLKRKLVRAKTGGRCAYCGMEAHSIDHAIPKMVCRLLGIPRKELSNLLPCCIKCNRAKGSMSMEDWRAKHGPFFFETQGATFVLVRQKPLALAAKAGG